MSSLFIERIKPARPTRAEAAQRRFVYVPYDRQTCEVGPLAQADPRTCGVVLIESSWKASRRPYHKQKLALLLANQRHFALELAARGYKVIYQASDRSYGETLRALAGREGIPSFTTTHPAERELRVDLEAARAAGLSLELRADETWLTQEADSTTPFRMALLIGWSASTRRCGSGPGY